MATELHQPEIVPHSQDISRSAILDHGSISFGRFAAESLAWEKWSVFRHNRCQEELEMYKSNGLVAQKKAYFEEYYKRVRALKALQSEHRETADVKACADVRINSVQSENGCSSNDMLEEGIKSANGTVVETTQANKELLNDYAGSSDNFTVRDEASNTLSHVELEQSSLQASVSANLPVAGSYGVLKPDTHFSAPVKLDTNEKKKLGPPSKAKGGAASDRNKSKLDSASTKEAVKALAKAKPLPLKQINGKSDNILLPSISNYMAASGKNSSQVFSRRKLTEVHSSAVPHPSSKGNRMVQSSPCGTSDQKNTITNGKILTGCLRRSQAVLNPSRKKPTSSGLKDKALEKRDCPVVSRKPIELSSQQMQPKVFRSENQRPIPMLPNIVGNRLMRDTEAGCGHKTYGKQKKEKEGGIESNSTFRRETESSFNPSSSNQKNLKPVRKGKEELSTIRRKDPQYAATVASVVVKNSKPYYKV